MVRKSIRAVGAPKLALFSLLALACAQAALAASGFSPQRRVGYFSGDQWEPALAADKSGHVYILFPQYGAVGGCPACASPAMTLIVSHDNGLTWDAPHTLATSATGQFDPQIVVDSEDRQTLYASWLQNNKRDVMVARSQDFGRSWYMTVAARAEDDADKPVLAVRGADVYVGFNHEENFIVAASHDYAENFSSAAVNAGAEPGWSLAGGATVDPSGEVYFSWTAYSRRTSNNPIALNVSRSADGGRTWNTVVLDTSAPPPGCAEESCEAGYLGPQIALASDAAGTLYALWNAGRTASGPERIYFASSTTAGASWLPKVDISTAGAMVEHCFPAIASAAGGDVRLAWMDTRHELEARQPLWNVLERSSSNGGASWSAEAQLSGVARGYDYIFPEGFRFPFGDYFSLAIDNLGTTHAVWGEGKNFKSPGSIWYASGR